MKRSKFSEQQIAFILRQAEEGTSVEEVCRKAGVSQQTYYLYGRPKDATGTGSCACRSYGRSRAQLYDEVRPHSSIGQKTPVELANASGPACRP